MATKEKSKDVIGLFIEWLLDQTKNKEQKWDREDDYSAEYSPAFRTIVRYKVTNIIASATKDIIVKLKQGDFGVVTLSLWDSMGHVKHVVETYQASHLKPLYILIKEQEHQAFTAELTALLKDKGVSLPPPSSNKKRIDEEDMPPPLPHRGEVNGETNQNT